MIDKLVYISYIPKWKGGIITMLKLLEKYTSISALDPKDPDPDDDGSGPDHDDYSETSSP